MYHSKLGSASNSKASGGLSERLRGWNGDSKMDKTSNGLYGKDHTLLETLERLIPTIENPELREFVGELHFRISGELVRDMSYNCNDIAELIIQTLDSKQRQKVN